MPGAHSTAASSSCHSDATLINHEDQTEAGKPDGPQYGPFDGPFNVIVPPRYDLPNFKMDVVIIHGLYGSSQDESLSGPGSGSTEWVKELIGALDCPCEVIRFKYEPLKLFAGHQTRKAIKRCALDLLQSLDAFKAEDNDKRLITFIAQDIGGIILKEAMITAYLGNNEWSRVFEMSRILVFQGVPHRSLGYFDMEERLSRFFYASYDPGIAIVRPSISSIPDFVDAVIEINDCFADAKIPLRSKIISIHGRDVKGAINPVFDAFCATMGVALGKRFLYHDLAPDLVHYLEGLQREIFISVDKVQLQHERMILALSSPVYPFRTPKTENPVIDSDIYQSWLAHPGPQILYIHGSNKVREVAEQVFYSLDDLADKESKRTIVLYFSFDRWDVRVNSLSSMLSTFLAQIMCHFPGLADQIKVTFDRFRQERGWTEADLIHLFERFRLTDQVHHVMLVINHFDECTKGSPKLFLDHFRHLSQTSELPWKVVVTSHRPGTLSDHFAAPWAVHLDLANVKPDLDPKDTSSPDPDMTRLIKLRPDLNLLEGKLQEEVKVFRGFDPLLKRIILDQARLRFDWPDKTTSQEILGPLHILPAKDREEQNLLRVLQWVMESVSVLDRQFLRRFLTWLLYSVRPLSVRELASAVYLGTTHDDGGHLPSLSVLKDFTSKIYTWFAGVMYIEQNEVRMHPRLRDLLMGSQPGRRTRSKEPVFVWEEIRWSAHSEMTKLCLNFLSRPSVKEFIDSTFKDATSASFESPMAADRGNLCSYALQAWTHHFLLSPPTDELKEMLSQHASGDLAHSWARGYWALSNPVTRSPTCLETLFPVFAGLGRLDIVQARGAEDVRRGLLEAASRGQAETVSKILKTRPRGDPSFSANSQVLVDALRASAACGDEGLMLDMLGRLEARHDFDKSRIPSYLIHRSAWLGLHCFAGRILELGCDPNVEEKWSTTVPASPLSQAARNHHVETVRTLLKHGADVDCKHKDGRTAIHHVAVQGRAEIAEVLVKEGNVDVESRDVDGLTALHLACLWGQHHIAEALLDLGADPIMGIKAGEERTYRSPLEAAADGGFERCVELLLDREAARKLPRTTTITTTTTTTTTITTTTAKTKTTTTTKDRDEDKEEDEAAVRSAGALVSAAVKGHLGVCKILLSRGADPNSPSIKPPILTQVLFRYQGTKNQEEVFELLLSHGADPNAKDEEGEPLLLAAVTGRKGQFVQKLLDHGADVEMKNSANHTALSYAASNASSQAASEQDEGIVDMLLAKDANPNVLISSNHTALSYALASASITKKLLDKGADPNMYRGDCTCLMFAAWKNYPKTIQLLLEHNASLEGEWKGRDEGLEGHTALSMAVYTDNIESVRLLAEAGANLKHVTAFTGTPVIHHAARQSTLCAILGFPSRIDLNQRDKYGCTAVHMLSTQLENLRHLINAGAEINLQDSQRGNSPLSVAAKAGDLDRVKLLVSRGAELELGSPYDGTALTQACLNGHFEVVKHLVGKGADVNASCASADGTPLSFACLQHLHADKADNQAAMIDYLIARGADVSGAGGLFGTPIIVASYTGHPGLMGKLIEKGAPVDVRDEFGSSPVHFAALNGVGNFRVILDAGGDVKARDATGRLPIHWAAQAGRLRVLEAIEEVVPIKEMVDATDLDGWTPLCWAARGVGNSVQEWCASEEADQIGVIRYLLKNGANRDVIAKVGKTSWTPLKIAKFHGQPPELLDLLRYGLGGGHPAGPEADQSETGYKQHYLCDVCQNGIRGYVYHCSSRDDFDLCFKCIKRAKKIEALQDDSFRRGGPEFAGGKPENWFSDWSDSDSDYDW